MKKFMDMVAAKLFVKANDESGDVVQTLIIIAFGVIVAFILFNTLQGPIQECADAVASGSGTCFGRTVG